MPVEPTVKRPVSLVLSCEHAGREVPARHRSLFDGPEARAALESHRGWDPGAGDLARALATRLGAPLVVERTTRLLVECNRSIGHPQLWSEFSRNLPDQEKERLLAEIWRPHRDAVRRMIASQPPGLVVHVGVHSFTPVWRGRRRPTGLGLLCDPRRVREVRVVEEWRRALTVGEPEGLVVHRNRPYRGWTDGLVTALRSELPEPRYAGLELEVSQALLPMSTERLDRMVAGLELAAAHATNIR
jgi:predicted N-formylglutamate amidohydrolase